MRALLVVASIVLTILALEAVVRLSGMQTGHGTILSRPDKPQRTVDGVVLWEMEYPRSDAADIERAAQRRDAFTILGLGDSIMYGVQQERDQTYLEEVRRRLADRAPRPVEILNLATPGFNTAQENAVYKELADRLQPDLVIVHYWQNDAHQYRAVGGYVVDFGDISPDGRFVVRALPLPDALSDWLLIHSRLYQLLTNTMLSYWRRNQPDDWSTVATPLAAIDERVRRGGGRLLVLASPSMVGERAEPVSDLAKLQEFADARGIEVIDLSQWLRDFDAKTLSFDGSHFTARGHEILGARLADYLLAHDLRQPPAAAERADP